MKKNNLINKFFLMLGLSVAALSCSDDDGGGASAGFESIASSYYEENGDGTVTVLFRDGSVSEDDLIIDGSATEGEDYTITGVSEEGITFSILDDVAAEKIETIRIRVKGSSGAANSVHSVRLISDDPGFMDIELQWADAVDLDLISWFFDPTDQTWHDIDFSDPGNTLDPIDWTDADGLYGFTYNYFGGSDNSVPFSVVFTPTGVTLEGGTDPLTFQATYTLANVDPNNVQIEQVVTKTGADFSDFSDIEVPATGSRKAEILAKLRKAAAELHTKKRE
jgi:hypothetical protein